MKTIEYRFDPTVKSKGQNPVISHILRNLNSSYSSGLASKHVDLHILATKINALDKRRQTAVMEIVMDYDISNPSVVTVMGSQMGAPYGGVYNQKDTSIDLANMPPSLILMLDKFIEMNETHSRK